MRQELKSINEVKTIKYVNPIIIGTLFVSIWDVAVTKMVNQIGFWSTLVLCMGIIVTISICIGWVRRIYNEDREFFMMFDEFSSLKRLDELVLYRILKSQK